MSFENLTIKVLTVDTVENLTIKALIGDTKSTDCRFYTYKACVFLGSLLMTNALDAAMRSRNS